MMLLFQHRKVRQKRGSRLALSCRFTGFSQKLKHRSLLCAQSLCDCQHSSNKLAAECGLRPEAHATPDHSWAQSALGCVVSRLDADNTHKQPERLLDLEQLLTGSRSLRPDRLIPTRYFVSSALFKPFLDGSANLNDGCRKAFAGQRAIADAMPQLEQFAGLDKQSFADRFRFFTAIRDLLEFADQVRPTQLPPIKWPPTVARPPICDQVAGKLAQQLFGRGLAAAQVDLEDCHPTCDHHPQPGFAPRRIIAITIALPPAGLIHIGCFLLLGKLRGLCDRRLKRFGNFLSQIVDCAQCHFDLKEIFQHFLCLPVALAVLSTEHTYGCRQPRPVATGRDIGRQTPTSRFTTVRTNQLMQPMFIYQWRGLRQFDHLMSQRIGIVACQSRSTIAALGRAVIAHTAALFRRIELSLMSFVAGLSAAFLATRLPFSAGRLIRRIARWRLRAVARRSLCLFPKPFNLDPQFVEFFFQRGHLTQNLQKCLLDTEWCERPVFRGNLDLRRSKRFGFHRSETTKSDFVFHDDFSTGVGATP